MSDQEQDVQEDIVEGTDQQEDVVDDMDPVEEEARSQGWLPKEEYTGDKAKWVSAETFVARAPLFDKIDDLSKKIRNLEQGNKALATHYQKMREVEYNRAVDDLRAQHRMALEEGELVIADEIKDKIADVRAEAKAAAKMDVAPVEPAPAPEFTAWLDSNKWYSRDEELRDAADVYGIKYSKQGLSTKEVLLKVSEQIKKSFPDKFRNPNKDKASAVEGKSAVTGRSRAPSIEDSMTAEERKIMHRVIDSAGITKEQYLKDYADIQGVK